MFTRLGLWCHDRRRLVLGLWIAILAIGGALSIVAGPTYSESFDLPDVESKVGNDILTERFGGIGAGQVGTVVFRAEQGVDAPEVAAAMQSLLDDVASMDGVSRVQSPFDDGGDRLISTTGEAAGKIAYANVEMPEDIDMSRAGDIGQDIRDLVPDVAGLEIKIGGQVFAGFEPPSSEVIGLAFAIVILIVAFGSVLAMGVPVGVALFGIGLGSILVTFLTRITSVPDLATFVGIMIGLGVGIDYALLIVTRYREQLHDGHDVRESIGIAMDTAGRSVFVAGLTVVISLLAMLVMGVAFVRGLGLSAAIVVAITIVASLTLLPALLGLAGPRIEVTRWRGLIAAGLAALALIGLGTGFTPLLLGAAGLAALVLLGGFVVEPLRRIVPHRAPPELRRTFAYRWSRVIQHHPWIATIGATGLLVLLMLPTLGLRLGVADESNAADDTDTKQAYDLLVNGFGPGFNGPLVLAAELPRGVDLALLDRVTTETANDEGVVFVSPPQLNDPNAPTAVVWNLVPTSSPQDRATQQLVGRLRDDILPSIEQEAGFDIAVTGVVAVNLDFSAFLSSRYIYFFTAVLVLSFLLLMMVFRSLLVPLKAVIMNLLSIGASYGIVVMLFQWGWLGSITGVSAAPIEPWAPMMLFAIVFGLSMDYEVFLLSRVREEFHRTGDARTSVADGLASTAKVITAAAAIMVVVFGSFLLESDRAIKLMGTGLATAILLDATVVRMLLVPATMELLGEKNWWLPKWIDRWLPTLDVEGHRPETGTGFGAEGDRDGDHEPARV